MTTLDTITNYFTPPKLAALDSMAPIKIGGARINKPSQSIALHIEQMKHNREDSAIYLSSLHHLQNLTRIKILS